MDWWEDELCERVTAGARFVIRNRVEHDWDVLVPAVLEHTSPLG